MKKIMAVMLSLLACTVLLAGCNTSSESNEEQSLKVYSFSGENEYISVSNGVIILDTRRPHSGTPSRKSEKGCLLFFCPK